VHAGSWVAAVFAGLRGVEMGVVVLLLGVGGAVGGVVGTVPMVLP